MIVISISEAKNKLTQIVHDVENGETVELTRHGTPSAVILSLDKYRDLMDKPLSFISMLKDFRETMEDNLLLDDEVFPQIRGDEEGREVSI